MQTETRAVTREQIAEMARRYDTAMALAFCAALGIEHHAHHRPHRHRRRHGRWKGMEECRRNERGVDPDAGRY